MDRGAWRATVHGVAKESDMTEQLSTSTSVEKKKIPTKIAHIPIVRTIFQMLF